MCRYMHRLLGYWAIFDKNSGLHGPPRGKFAPGPASPAFGAPPRSPRRGKLSPSPVPLVSGQLPVDPRCRGEFCHPDSPPALKVSPIQFATSGSTVSPGAAIYNVHRPPRGPPVHNFVEISNVSLFLVVGEKIVSFKYFGKI